MTYGRNPMHRIEGTTMENLAKCYLNRKEDRGDFAIFVS
jgi:hypothetical protein